MRAQAFYIVQDPYANAYSSHWHDVDKLSKSDRVIGRGGWVANIGTSEQGQCTLARMTAALRPSCWELGDLSVHVDMSEG